MMIRLLRWSEVSRWRRWLLIVGLIAVPGGIGLLVGQLRSFAVFTGVALTLIVLVLWLLATTPPPLPRDGAGRDDQTPTG